MKTSALRVVSTFFLLWLSVYLDETMEIIGAYIFILSFGILHGANDIILLQKISNNDTAGKKFSALLAYVGSVLFVALIFYFLPGLALLLFVLLSGYHFGEEHWEARLDNPGWAARVFYAAYGILILCLLFLLHETEVGRVIESISGTVLPDTTFLYACIISGMVMLLSALTLRPDNRSAVFVFKEFFYLLVFYLVFRSTSLLWAFAIYFVIWHSLPSLVSQLYFLYGNITKKTVWAYIKSSALYWIASVVAIGFLYWFFRGEEYSFLSLLFPFIAALTFPHVLVMIFMDRHSN